MRVANGNLSIISFHNFIVLFMLVSTFARFFFFFLQLKQIQIPFMNHSRRQLKKLNDRGTDASLVWAIGVAQHHHAYMAVSVARLLFIGFICFRFK